MQAGYFRGNLREGAIVTDRDKIELPPLPGEYYQFSKGETLEYARAAVLADRERRAEPAKPAEPKVHSARVYLTREGYVWTAPPSGTCAHIELCWTDDGRAWIESEKNRELAKRLRYYASTLQPEGFRWHDFADAADALDGGVR